MDVNKTHNYLVCSIIECIPVNLDRRLANFMHSMINKHGVRELIAHFLTTQSSVFAENCRYLMCKYNISVFAWYIRDKVVCSKLSPLETSSLIEIICTIN